MLSDFYKCMSVDLTSLRDRLEQETVLLRPTWWKYPERYHAAHLPFGSVQLGPDVGASQGAASEVTFHMEIYVYLFEITTDLTYVCIQLIYTCTQTLAVFSASLDIGLYLVPLLWHV